MRRAILDLLLFNVDMAVVRLRTVCEDAYSRYPDEADANQAGSAVVTAFLAKTATAPTRP